MTHLQAEVILALADNGLRINNAARETYRHHNTIRYHIAEIQKETGLNPLDFWDMQKLVPMAQAVIKQQEE